MNLYFDNASTSFPKPIEVVESVNNFMVNIGASSSRGFYKNSIESNRILFNCRESLCSFFNYNKPQNIVFSHNATYAFNLLLNSLINSEIFSSTPHILVSKLDHNSTLRPLMNLNKKGIIQLEFLNCTKNNFIDLEDFKNKIKSNTRVVILSHMSNVLGNIQDIKHISEICKTHSIYFILDCAQSCGIVDINLSNLYFSSIIFTGHKNLFSTHGIGGFVISDDLLNKCENYFLGGTGSDSSNLISKDNMPDYFEIGTQNMIGICSLLSGLNFINSLGLNTIFEHKKHLIKIFYNKIKDINDIILLNDVLIEPQNSTVCINFKNITPDESSFILNKHFNISVRVGLHCAPETHKLINTYPLGCIRISPGIFNTEEDVDFLISSINKISKNLY